MRPVPAMRPAAPLEHRCLGGDDRRSAADRGADKDFIYKTRKSWSRRRRVVGKAERLSGGPNARFVVTSISKEDTDTSCSTRTCIAPAGTSRTASRSSSSACSWTAPAAPPCARARSGCGSPPSPTSCCRPCAASDYRVPLARAQCDTLRLKLLKIGAQVRVTVRKSWVSLARGSPYATTFEQTYYNVLAASPCC
jgi:DDE family transposase